MCCEERILLRNNLVIYVDLNFTEFCSYECNWHEHISSDPCRRTQVNADAYVYVYVYVHAHVMSISVSMAILMSMSVPAGSINGFAPKRQQAITQTDADQLC